MLKLLDLRVKAGSFSLKDINLEVPSESYGVLLGPPGSGKSVLVETLCGLRHVEKGRIILDGEDITLKDPKERFVGYVPQDYVLFPTKRVVDNVTFGLRIKGLSRKEALKEASWVIDLLGIRYLLERWPETLSGGEKQRVALARALAIRPRLLLLDEPVSALDEGLRDRVCRDLKHLQKELKLTTIHVSHNMEEALAVSDWAALLFDGAIAQVGPMKELLEKPRNAQVAQFLRAENIISAQAEPLDEGQSEIRFSGHTIRAPGRFRGNVTVCIRPESLRVRPLQNGPLPNSVPATLIDVTDLGIYRRLSFDAGIQLTCFTTQEGLSLTPGKKYLLYFSPEKVHVMPEC